MVKKAERYPYSSQRAYLGIEPDGIVDVDPVLRHFGAKKEKARENFAQFVAAGAKLGHQEEYYLSTGSCILGSDEFVDEMIHRLGEATTKRSAPAGRKSETREFDPVALANAAEKACGISKADFCSPGKSRQTMLAKDALILSGLRAGATMTKLRC